METGDDDVFLLKEGQKTRCPPPRTCLLCWGAILAFLCIVTSIVVPVVLLLVDESQFNPTNDICSTQASQLIKTIKETNIGFNLLTNITDNFGPRLSGSQNLENAIDWIINEMKSQGLENVKKEPVMVPAWQRGIETLTMTKPFFKNMQILGLGGSINTTINGIEGEILVVNSETQLQALSGSARNKIIVFNVPFTTYGSTVYYRSNGANLAAKYNAKAALVRSVTPFSLYTPHTGNMHYSNDSLPRVPAAAITVEDAELLQRLNDAGHIISLKLSLIGNDGYINTTYVNGTRYGGVLQQKLSHNVMAELSGNENKNDVIVMGGHIDSWDVGLGALDDMGGFVAAWTALLMIKSLNLTPLRTIRVVGWTNEENGGKGAEQYALDHANESTIFAMESDGGVNKPTGIIFKGNDEGFKIIKSYSELLSLIGTNQVTRAAPNAGVGADIGPLVAQNVPGAGLLAAADANYFFYHHTNADVPDIIDNVDLQHSASTLGVYALCVALNPLVLPSNRNTTFFN